ncbi:MAG: D-2-hydroxyacid dehydrogenase [Xanthobacteraceae bacterium]
MPQIDAVLCTLQYQKEHIERLRRAFYPAEFIHLQRRDDAALLAALERIDVAVLKGDLDSRFLRARQLRWVHCDHAGLERSAKPEVLEKGLLVTSSAGRSAPALAEHAMFFMLALAYNFPAFYAAQQARRWGAENQTQLRALRGQTVGIVGMGHIGKALALRCKAFEMRILGYRRRATPCPEGVDQLYSVERGDTLQPILEQSDFLVLSVPLTNSTQGLIGARELRCMKSSAFLINIARGALVDESALFDALRAGRLAGAGLDTFELEPLPRSSPLWNAPRTIITPHVTPRLADRVERSLEIICENIRRYLSGEPLLNLLTEREVYSRSALSSRAIRRSGWLARIGGLFRGSAST